jgi:hypothetical protein
MIESIFKGNKYRYCKSDKGNYWVGANRSLGGGWGSNYYPGNNCHAPTCIWTELQEIAVSSGVCSDEFITKKPEVKEKKAARKKNNGPSISIF